MLLLDSHVVLWWLADDQRLGPVARDAIGREVDLVYVSAASIWELAIKVAAERLVVDTSDLLNEITTAGFQLLSINGEHAIGAAQLPYHHRDPFDRMLISQARLEHLTLVTADPIIRRYEVQVLPARA